MLSADSGYKQVGCTQIRPKKMSFKPDLDPNYSTLIMFLKEFFEKVNCEKSQQMTTKACNITQHAKLVFLILQDEHTVVPAKSDSDVIFCLQSFSKTLTCTRHLKCLSSRESIDHLCINPILQIGLIHK